MAKDGSISLQKGGGLAILAIVFAYLLSLALPISPTFLSFDSYQCDLTPYHVRFLSYDPVIAHLENFVLPAERDHLINLAQTRFQRSTVLTPENLEAHADTGRTSSTAVLPGNDPVVQCVKKRAAQFQGYTDLTEFEALQITHYEGGQQFKPHYDWYSIGDGGKTDRYTTTFAYLDASCTACGTQFPYLRYNWTEVDARWCTWVDCQESSLTVRPIPGSAVFWRNLYSDGKGDKRVFHEGIRLNETDFKTGLNIWTLMKIDE